MNTEKMKLAVFAVAFGIGLTACEKQYSAENAGKKIDQAVEKAGEKVDRASEKLSEQAVHVDKAIEDASITAKVKAKILADPNLKSLEIHVGTTGGVVTLSGLVDSKENSDKAKQIAAAVSDVKEVDNRLSVKSTS